MKALLCGEHVMFLEALSTSLTSFDVDVVGWCTTTQRAIELADARTPDVCVVGGSCAATLTADDAAALRGRHRTRLILLASEPSVAPPVPADARLSLVDPLEVVVEAMTTTVSDDHATSMGVGPRIAATYDDSDARLTRRERQVLQLMAGGASISQLARELDVSTSTLRSHVRSVMRKLGAHNRAQAVEIAIERRLVRVGPMRDLPERRNE
jgi:DNA-binding NarL/FixJ family response regulator